MESAFVPAEFVVSRTLVTVLDPASEDVIGCVYIYPDKSDEHDARVLSWVRATRADDDVELWRAVSERLANAWPFERVAYAERSG